MSSPSTALTVERYDYRAGLIFSLLVHLALLYILQQHQTRLSIPDRVINVVLESPPVEQKQSATEAEAQIVSQPENLEASKPVETRLLAEKDSLAEREQIRRGEHPNAGSAASQQASKAPPQQKAPRSSPPSHLPAEAPGKELPNQLTTLKLDQATLITKYSDAGKSSALPSSNASGYRAFSRPIGSGAAFIGLKGSTDFLPNLPDGDITLLNTKADRFAVFVRRVASQVFGQLRASGWENLSSSDIARMSDDTTVTVVMSIDGAFESIKLVDGSGSTAFDRVVVEAARHGARDPNPPKAAAATDGKIHFTFQARSWVQAATNQRTGAPTERRWLLLATGLD